MGHTDLSITPSLIDALRDADGFEGGILIPLRAQLEKAATHDITDANLRITMAEAVLSIMKGFAQRRHIGLRSELGFTTALAFLAYAPEDLPGLAPERLAALPALRVALLRAPNNPRHRPLHADAGFFTTMGAVLLCAARTIAAGTDDGFAPFADTGAVLFEGPDSLRYLLRTHALLSGGHLPVALSEKDQMKLRMVLDIAEPMLPQGLSPRRPDLAAMIARLAADPAAQITTMELRVSA